MDISKIMKTLLSNDAISGISEKTGASAEDIKKVLAQALPGMISGAQQQAEDEGSGFAQALNDHAAANTSNIGSFLQNVDLGDGAKIIGHLLGAKGSTANAKEVAKATGVKQSLVSQIMSAAAPLLMSLLGQQTTGQNSSNKPEASTSANSSTNPIGGLMGSLLGNVDIGSLAMDLLGGGSSSSSSSKPSSSKPSSSTTGKKKKTSSTSTSTGKKKTDSSSTSTGKKKTESSSSSTGKKKTESSSSSTGKKKTESSSSSTGKKKTTTSSTSTGKKKTTAATSASAKKTTSKKDEKKEEGLLDSAVSFLTGLLK